jgi:hypothetical protein
VCIEEGVGGMLNAAYTSSLRPHTLAF